MCEKCESEKIVTLHDKLCDIATDVSRIEQISEHRLGILKKLDKLVKACRESTAPNYLAEWQRFAEDMATKPNLAVYRQKFIALSALLKRTRESAEQISQALKGL